MLKPNYGSKENNNNYKIGHGHSNMYFNSIKTMGINELLINGYLVMFIPKYDFQIYHFPPSTLEMLTIRNSVNEFKNVHQRRVFSFYYAALVFFEYPEKAAENFYFYSDENLTDEEKKSNFGLIHCIDSSTFSILTKEMQRKMPYIQSARKLSHHIRHDDIADLKFVQFLDAKFQELKELLPHKFRVSLEL